MRIRGRSGVTTAALVGALGLMAVLLTGCGSDAPRTSSGSAEGGHQAGGGAAGRQEEPVPVTAVEGTLTEVVMTNAAGKPVKGAISRDRSTWTSAETLGYGKAYSVTATGTGADGKTNSVTSKFT